MNVNHQQRLLHILVHSPTHYYGLPTIFYDRKTYRFAANIIFTIRKSLSVIFKRNMSTYVMFAPNLYV